MNYHVSIAGVKRVVTIGPNGVTLDGKSVDADWVRTVGNAVSGRGVIRLEDGAHSVVYGYRARGHLDSSAPAHWSLSVGGATLDAVVLDDRQQTIQEMVTATAAQRGPQPIKAPMPGMVVKVDVAVGDPVAVDQGVVVVEAMKMENELLAQTAGIVRRIHVKAGQAVEKDQILVEFEG